MSLRKAFIFILLIFIISFKQIYATGVGIKIFDGSPEIALTFKSHTYGNNSQLDISWSNGLYLGADYLMHFYPVGGSIELYLGLGGAIYLSNNTSIDLRLPLGIGIFLSKLEIFIEGAPLVGLYPDMVNKLSSPKMALGIRYYFSSF